MHAHLITNVAPSSANTPTLDRDPAASEPHLAEEDHQGEGRCWWLGRRTCRPCGCVPACFLSVVSCAV